LSLKKKEKATTTTLQGGRRLVIVMQEVHLMPQCVFAFERLWSTEVLRHLAPAAGSGAWGYHVKKCGWQLGNSSRAFWNVACWKFTVSCDKWENEDKGEVTRNVVPLEAHWRFLWFFWWVSSTASLRTPELEVKCRHAWVWTSWCSHV